MPLLEDFFHELNRHHFGAELPVPRLSWNARLSSTAGRFCPGSRSLLRPRLPHIEVAKYLRDLPDGAMHVRDTMLHEMIHYYLWHKQRPHGHTPEFHRIMKRVGAKRYNTVPKERAWKHWYECPSCREGFPTRRSLGVSACARCCERYNRGRYHDRFRLVRMVPRPELLAREKEPRLAASNEAIASALLGSAPPPEKRLTPSEIIRRLEQLKNMVKPRG